MNTIQTLKTALSNDTLAYASLANVLSPDHLHINPKRIVWRLLVSACLMLGGMLAVFCAIAGVSRAAGSPEAEGFIVILFCAGSLVSLASLVHMVLNAAYAVVIQRVLIAEKEVALQSKTEETEQVNYESGKAAALEASVTIFQQEKEQLQEKIRTLETHNFELVAQLVAEQRKKSDQPAVRSTVQHVQVRTARPA